MRTPIFIRPFTQDEQHQIQAGLRSSDAFVMRRCQILRASARGERAPEIAHQLGGPSALLMIQGRVSLISNLGLDAM